MGGNITRMMGERIRDAREELGMNQTQLSEQLGFNDRQTVSNIERGERKISSNELIKLMDIMGKPLEYFTDPFLITQKEVFSWRVSSEEDLCIEYEEKAKKLIASYREFSRMLGRRVSALSPCMQVTKHSSYDDVEEIAEFLIEQWELYDVSDRSLVQVLEEDLHILVMYVDAPKYISGASCQLDDLNCILINKNEPIGRQNFNIAHELFHILTWNIFPPKRIDQAQQTPKPKSEKLADKFASVLLMPRQAIIDFYLSIDDEDDVLVKIKRTARKFHVSVAAAYWRLVFLKQIKRFDEEYYKKIIEYNFVDSAPKPLLYSKSFIELVHNVIHKGIVSVRKVTSLLECSHQDLEDLFESYQLKGLYER